ncbi:MAG: GHMP kinase, partial [Vicinamibacteria bacterium]
MRITASAPTRIDLAGGTIDIWPLFLFHDGAQTLNAAISLRAHAEVTPRPGGGVELVAGDIGRRILLDDPHACDEAAGLPLLARLARAFGLRDATLTTRGESPAGAGIAGSSALNIAVCGALARWTGRELSLEALMTTAMNVEAQVIRVPTGLQDYRPAAYGGIAALELGVEGPRRVALDVDPRDLERRLVLCYTGAPRNSG